MNLPAAAAHFLGYRYASRSADNRAPVVRGCLPVALAWRPGDDRRVDCSTFISALAVYMAADLEWDAAAYADMQIMDAARLWSPLDAWARHGIGARMEPGEACQGWGLYQGWADTAAVRGGHQWAYHGGMGIRVHASSIGDVGPIWERVAFSSLAGKYRSGIQGVRL